MATCISAMTEVERAWLAGLLEGEGCFSPNNRNDPCVQMQMTDEDVVRRAHALTGVGHVSSYPGRGANRKPTWRWRVSRRADAAAVLLAVRPFMGERRARRIDETLVPYIAQST